MYVCMYVCWPVMYVCSMVVDRWGGVGRQTGRSARAKKKKKKVWSVTKDYSGAV